jgi:TRAP-type C4-dicarboxylate transport system permease small subunit
MGRSDDTPRRHRISLTTVAAFLLLGCALLAWLVISLGGDGGEYWWSTETAQIAMGIAAGCLIVGALLMAAALLLRAWRRFRRFPSPRS